MRTSAACQEARDAVAVPPSDALSLARVTVSGMMGLIYAHLFSLQARGYR